MNNYTVGNWLLESRLLGHGPFSVIHTMLEACQSIVDLRALEEAEPLIMGLVKDQQYAPFAIINVAHPAADYAGFTVDTQVFEVTLPITDGAVRLTSMFNSLEEVAKPTVTIPKTMVFRDISSTSCTVLCTVDRISNV